MKPWYGFGSGSWLIPSVNLVTPDPEPPSESFKIHHCAVNATAHPEDSDRIWPSSPVSSNSAIRVLSRIHQSPAKLGSRFGWIWVLRVDEPSALWIWRLSTKVPLHFLFFCQVFLYLMQFIDFVSTGTLCRTLSWWWRGKKPRTGCTGNGSAAETSSTTMMTS